MTRILVIALAALVPAAAAYAEADPAETEALIANALSAAPAAVAAGATVVLPPDTVLREGTNGWTCMPDDPTVPNNSPMCLDDTWLEVIDAWLSKRQPEIEGIGLSYMLQGDMPVSNVDPFATGPSVDNQWIQNGAPHIMVVVSDHSLLEGLSTDPDSGGPFVMWKGTPYAHIMIPTVPRP